MLGNQNRNAGTTTFCLSGTGTVYIPVLVLDPNVMQKSKFKNLRPTFRETMLILALKRQDFLHIFCC